MTIDEFEELLERRIDSPYYTTAPNGAYYRVANKNGAPGCWRCYSFAKQAEFIVGFNSLRFESLADAKRWALADGRCEIGKAGTPLSERRVIE